MTTRALVKLPSLKGIPQQIEWVIRCVSSTERLADELRWRALTSCLGPRLQSLSLHRVAPKVENLISAQSLPTAERLGLIEGTRTRWELTYTGRRLLDVVEHSERLRLRLARILLELDKENWHLVHALRKVQTHPGAAVGVPTLVVELGELGIDPMEGLNGVPSELSTRLDKLGCTYQTSACRLSDMLQYFDWVDLIRFHRGTVTLSIGRVEDALHESLEEPEGSVRMEEFFGVLLKHYKRLLRSQGASPFVAIRPVLIDSVCDELHIGVTHFTKLLSKLPTEFEGYQLLLSPYMSRREAYEVVQIGKRQYYYVSLYPLKRTEEH